MSKYPHFNSTYLVRVRFLLDLALPEMFHFSVEKFTLAKLTNMFGIRFLNLLEHEGMVT